MSSNQRASSQNADKKLGHVSILSLNKTTAKATVCWYIGSAAKLMASNTLDNTNKI
jgi:hypothetical protein